jgi:hypothetical protein
MWALVIAVAGVACAQEPPNMHELECAIHTFAHAYGVSKVRTNCLLKLLLKPERQCCMIIHAIHWPKPPVNLQHAEALAHAPRIGSLGGPGSV